MNRLALSVVLAAGSALAEPGDVSWRLIRPSNTGIPGDYTQAIFIDDDDSPWIAGYVTFWEEGGMAHFDGHSWRVLGNVDCPQVFSPRFNDIVKTDDGIMWIASDSGLLRFDPTAEPWCVTRLHAGNTPMTGNQIADLAVAPDGTLWIASQELGGSAAGGLGHYDPSTGAWEFWDTTNGLPWWAGWNWVDYVSVQPDAAGGYTVWFGQQSMGLTTYKDGLFVWYGSATPPDVTPLPTGVPGKSAVDDLGNLLLSTNQGLAIRATDGSYTMLGGAPVGGSSVARVNLLPSGRVVLGTFGADMFLWAGAWSYIGNWGSGNHTYAIAEESTGAIWAGGIGGASRYENGAWQRYRLTNTGMLDFFTEDLAVAPNGDVAMTANAAPGVGGFDILHPDGTWTNANVATYGLGLPWPYPTDNTSAVAYRANGNLLFAPTNNGLKEYDGDGFIEKISGGWSIEFATVANDGRAWATTGNGSMFMEDNDGIMTTRFLYADGLPVGSIAGIKPDPIDPASVWVGAQFGLAKTDGNTWLQIPRETFGLNLDTLGYHITAFDIAADGTLWVASGIGLFHYDPTTGTYDAYNLSNSPLPSDDIFHVEIAPDGSIWISMFDHLWPYPGGVAQLKDGQWTVWRQGSSPLPHNQIYDIEFKTIPGGYEVWIACASEAVAVITVETGPAGCTPADLAEPFGVLDLADVQGFIAGFLGQDPIADLAPPAGVFDLADVQAFIASFTAGCS